MGCTCIKNKSSSPIQVNNPQSSDLPRPHVNIEARVNPLILLEKPSESIPLIPQQIKSIVQSPEKPAVESSFKSSGKAQVDSAAKALEKKVEASVMPLDNKESLKTRIRPDLKTLLDEYSNEQKKSIGKRKVTSLEKLVLAFQGIQKLDTKNSQSFFWLASYHGVSNEEIFELMRRQHNIESDSIFCAHGNIKFPTWHRPYMLEFEAALQSIDKEIMLPF